MVALYMAMFFRIMPISGPMENVCPADPENRVHENVSLGAVVNGKSVNIHITAFITAVNYGSHIMRHESLVIDDDSFGQGFGSARVSHLARLVDVERHIRLRGRVVLYPGVEVFELAVHRRFSRALIRPYQRFHGGHFIEHVLHQVIQSVLDYEDFAFRVVDGVGNVLPPEEIVDRQINSPDFAAAKPCEHMVDGIVGQNRHTVVFLHPERRKGVCGPVTRPPSVCS